jgi:hypothetical protein
MSAYRDLDDAICAYLSEWHGTHPIYSQALGTIAAQELGREYSFSDSKVWRLIDRRLQALRKAGRIKYVRGTSQKWVAVSD